VEYVNLQGRSSNGIFSQSHRAYIAGDKKINGFTIVEANESGGFSESGSFESSSFDAGSTVGSNYLTWNAPEPLGTNVRFQIATNNDDSTWNFVGPDGTSLSFYENPGAIPLNSVLGRYFRFKAFFSGDGSNTPVMEGVTVNYSP